MFHIKNLFLLFLVLCAFALSTPQLIHAQPPDAAAKAKIEASLLNAVAEEETAVTDFLIWLPEKADLSPAAKLTTKAAKGEFVFNALRQTADKSQAHLRAYLDQQGIRYKSFYISNKILVQRGNRDLLFAIAARPDVAKITANHTITLPQPLQPDKQQAPQGIEDSLSFIKADQVWQMGINGEGVVLAGNDTGLAWDHPALINHYRGWDGTTADHNYNWWDATGTYPAVPNDGFGHGTHITGTMVGDDGGDNQIGVAPGAQTIHCKNMDDFGGGYDASFIECFQWDLAPWDLNGENPRPDLAPDAINNSWGYSGGNYPAFTAEIEALQAAGILVEVSAGNAGPSCGTLGSPGDYISVLTTGSINHTSPFPGTITDFSSRGPSAFDGNAFAPDIMAPGENIRSSLPGGGYEAWSGTSMAGPHVTGLVGLLWSANPALRGFVAETQELIAQTAVPLSGQTGSNCGGDYDLGPNNDWGSGTIDALAATEAALVFGDPGTLQGTVSDSSTSSPLAGATIRIKSSDSSLNWRRTTDANGFYSTPVFSGTYTVTASLYSYYPASVPNVSVTSFQTTTLDIPLEMAPTYTITGTVTDAAAGWPLYAQIHIDGYPGEPVWTNPETGEYSVDLAAGINYAFRVTPWVAGYPSTIQPVAPLTGNQQLDFALIADPVSCNAPGYQPNYAYFENFENGDGGYLADGINSSWQYGTPTSGPGTAYSGSGAWATNLGGNYNDNEQSTLTSPDIDMSAFAGRNVIISWQQWLQIETGIDALMVNVSNDGGNSWFSYNYYYEGDPNWRKQALVLDPSFAVSNLRVQFSFYSDGSVTFPGAYIDDIGVGAAAPLPYLYNTTFESDDGGFTVEGSNPSWEWGTPTRGPGFAHSGSSAWATRLGENYNNNEASQLVSPIIDLSSAGDQFLQLSWWQWMQTEIAADVASVDVSNDGGATWTTLFGPLSGPTDWGWNPYTIFLEPSYATDNFRVRFTLTTDDSVTYPGFYVDDVGILPADLAQPTLSCNLGDGSLVIGHVLDGNTGAGINGATVRHSSGDSVWSQATPEDTAVSDGFYTIFSPAGNHTLTGSKSKYGAETVAINVGSGQLLVQDIILPTGSLSTAPAALNATLNMGEQTTLSFDLSNGGGQTADFTLRERPRGFTPASRQPVAPVQRVNGSFSPGLLLSASSSQRPATTPTAPTDAPWETITPFPAPTMDNTAAAFDGRVYVVGGVDFNSGQPLDQLNIYDPDSGSWEAGASMVQPRVKPSAAFVGDQLYVVGGWDLSGTPQAQLEIYDPASDSWQLGAPMPTPVAGAPAVALGDQLYVIGGCINGECATTSTVYRYDPAGNSWETVAPYPISVSWQSCGAIDGQLYCAGGVEGFGESNHTYRYDPASDSWERLADMVQTQWGSAFTSANGKLVISNGITNNFATITNQTFVYDPVTDSWAQDANSNEPSYRGASACGFYKIGGFSGISFMPTATVEWYPGLTECGNEIDVAWLSFAPAEGSVAAGGGSTISVTLDASVAEITQPGSYLAEIRVSNSTPYQIPNIPVTLTVNPPAGWGRVAGTVTGLAQCDQPGAALNHADVVLGEAALKSDASGGFVYWLPAGSYELTTWASGYVIQTTTVTVTAGETSEQQIALRLDAPCLATEADSVAVSVAENGQAERPFTLTNSGAGQLSYQLLETTQELTAVVPPVLPPANASSHSNHAAAAAGPMAIRQQASSPAPNAPASGWFAGTDLPGGMVRYAHAQCDEQPNSFYIFSGVDSTYQISTASWHYDASDNEWYPLADMPNGVEGATATCYQGRIYVMGGSGSSQFFVYDIANDRWYAAADLPRAVWGAASAAWNGKIFLVGGDSDFFPGGTSDAVNVYDIASDSWLDDAAPMSIAAVNMGYTQQGKWLYVAGGWGDDSPIANIAVTQRYDLASNSWEIGPNLIEARADMAMAATAQALYVMGGDKDGGAFFDATDSVERLDLASWTAWEAAEPLPVATTSNNGGFCTSDGLFPTQIWSVGGANNGAITGANRFHNQGAEGCYSVYDDVAWLTAVSTGSTISGDNTETLTLGFDATGLPQGAYGATLVLVSNDATTPYKIIPVTMNVGQSLVFLPVIGD
ncbi:MAG: S8 family serine peptidase [Chloroflexota bacterium]